MNHSLPRLKRFFSKGGLNIKIFARNRHRVNKGNDRSQLLTGQDLQDSQLFRSFQRPLDIYACINWQSLSQNPLSNSGFRSARTPKSTSEARPVLRPQQTFLLLQCHLFLPPLSHATSPTHESNDPVPSLSPIVNSRTFQFDLVSSR